MEDEKETNEIQDASDVSQEASSIPQQDVGILHDEKRQDTSNIIQQSKEILKSIKEENDRTEKLLQRREKLLAEEMLAGRAPAGEIQKEEEISDYDYAQRVLRGDFNKK